MKTKNKKFTFTSEYKSPIDRLVGIFRDMRLSYSRESNGYEVSLIGTSPDDLQMIKQMILGFGYLENYYVLTEIELDMYNSEVGKARVHTII